MSIEITNWNYQQYICHKQMIKGLKKFSQIDECTNTNELGHFVTIVTTCDIIATS